jgi:hypothetical protein
MAALGRKRSFAPTRYKRAMKGAQAIDGVVLRQGLQPRLQTNARRARRSWRKPPVIHRLA